MKSTVQRIVYYSRKVARFAVTYPRKANRFDRLIAYKAEMDRRIQAERRQPIW